MDDEITPLITKEDIQDLVIYKKFVRIDSANYTDEAYQYIKELIDAERAILFDRSTHRIWTLGEWFGGDVFKENLLYYSKLKVIDLDDELLSEVDAISPESTLAYRGKNHININASHDEDNKQDILEIELDIQNLLKNQPNNEFSLYIDDEGKIGIRKYQSPKFTFEKQDHIPNQMTITSKLIIDSTIPINEWPTFEIECKNCDFVSFDQETMDIIIDVDPNNYENELEETIKITYDDGYSSGIANIVGLFNIYCYYGCYKPDDFEFVDLGGYEIENHSIENIFKIDQFDKYYAFFRCPLKYKPIFIDNRRFIQGAWIKENIVTINDIKYQTYMTINLGLGNIEWKIVEDIKQ